MKGAGVVPLLLAATLIAAGQSEPRSVVLPEAIKGQAWEVKLGLPLGIRCMLSDGYWRITGGDAPQGISADVNGLHGNATEAGTYRFTVEAVNACQRVAVPVQLTVRHRPLLAVSTEAISAEAAAGGAPVTRRFQVSSDSGDLPFSVATANVPWLTVVPEATVTPSAGSALSSVPVRVQMRTADLKPGVYTAKVRVSAWSAGNSPEIDVSLTVR